MQKEQALSLCSFITRFQTEKPLYAISREPTMMRYEYGPAISDFMKAWFATEFSHLSYDSIQESFNKHHTEPEWIAGLTEEDTLLSIQYIIRTDRFVDGHINYMIENGVLPALLGRIRVLNCI